MKSHLSLIFSLFFIVIVHGQTLEQYVADTLNEHGRIDKSLQYDHHIYTGGMSVDNKSPQAVIRKLDTLGQVVWSTSEKDTLPPPDMPRCVALQHKGDGFIYAIFTFTNSSSFFFQVWKVDAKNGDIVYKTTKPHNGNAHFSNLHPYGKDTLIFLYTDTYPPPLNLNVLETNSGKIVQSLDLGIVYDNRYELTTDHKHNIFYSKRDTIFNISLKNGLTRKWSRIVPGQDYSVISQLHFDTTDGEVYCFGEIQPRMREVFIQKIAPSTGELIWSKALPQFQEHYFRTASFFGQHIYSTWKLSNTGSADIGVAKLDKQNGNIEWAHLHRYIGNVPQEQTFEAICVNETGIYLTGFYTVFAGNVNLNRNWGVVKIDPGTGLKLFTTLITKDAIPNYTDSYGVGIYAFQNRVLCMGNRVYRTHLTEELAVTLDLASGNILEEKKIGGYAQFNAQTLHLQELANGSFIAIQQLGKIPSIALLDEKGQVTWRGLMPEEFEIKRVKVLADTTVLLVGQTIYAFNPQTKKMTYLAFVLSDANTYGPYLADVVADPSLNEFFISYHSQVSSSYKVNVQMFYRQGSGWVYGPAADLIATTPDAIPSSQLMLDLNTDAFVSVVYGGLAHIRKSNRQVTDFRYRYARIFTHIDYYQQNFILAGGYDDKENVVLVKIDRNTLNEVWVDTLKIKGKSIKWIRGEQDSIIYIACSYVNKFLSIIKYNVEARRIVWSKTLREEEKDRLFFTDISFNRQDQYAMITGYLQNGDAQDQVFIIAVDADGSVLANMNQNGEFPGYNRGLVLNSPASSPYTFIGGSLNKKPHQASSAFISSFTGKDIQNSIKGLIFWDENKDGIHNPGEKNLALGQVIFNFTNRVYINNDGYFKALVSTGRYSVRYIVPKNWTLTTGQFTYQVDASQLSNLKDTLRFGIAPTQVIDQVEIFTTSTQLVCSEQAMVYVHLRNSGTSYQNIKVRMDHQSQPLGQNIRPDSIKPGKIYWSFDSIPPGTVKWLILDFKIPGIIAIGDSLSFNTVAYWENPLKMDSTRFKYEELLLCSFDPNDKLVRSSKLAKNRFTLFDQYLYYTIRFQNTGNYPARNITIIDTLDRDLDFATFEFLGASHPITEVIGKNNTVQFVFKSINLPDSSSNEMASHGFVSFRIKDRAGLAEKTEITNTAYIYFDQNPAIVTNTTLNILVSKLDELSTATHNPQSKSNFRVYPNPAQSYVIVASENANSPTRWALINAQGQTCLQGLTKTWPFEINTQHLPNGLYYLQLVGQAVLKVLVMH